MRIVSGIAGLVVVVAAVIVAIDNRGPMDITFFTYVLALPVYAALFAAGLIGFAAGGLTAWVSGRGWRRAARRHARRVTILEREISQQAKPRAVAPLPAQLQPKTEAPAATSAVAESGAIGLAARP